MHEMPRRRIQKQGWQSMRRKPLPQALGFQFDAGMGRTLLKNRNELPHTVHAAMGFASRRQPI